MAEELPNGVHGPELCIPYVTADSNENMSCLICNTELVTFNGYHILSVIGSTGSSLCDNINKVLRRDLEVVTARSSIVCKRCYSLFDELNATENKCAFMRREIESLFMKTCEIYNDAPPYSVPGVACQTDNDYLETTQPLESSSDLKLKISLSPRKRRGRPAKVRQANHDASVECIEVISEVQGDENFKTKKLKDKSEKKEVAVTYITEETLQSRQTRSSAKHKTKKKDIGPVETEIEIKIEEKKIEAPVIADVEQEYNIEVKDEIKADPERENKEHCSPNVGSENQSDGVDDNDDFEWKEETPIGMVNDSSDNDDDNEEEKTGDQNEDGWLSGSSKDDSNKKKKKKKKKSGDRKGERAFMVPIHECNQCGKKWRTVTELKSHVASHSDVRPYVCEICGQAYKMKKALDIHIGMHNGIHPFVCEYCNKSFTQKVGLEKHLPIHTGVTRFQCDLCGKRFIHQKSFNIHKMTHTGEKNIRCPICQLAVFSQSHLKRHYRVHTGERPYECTVCGKKFAEKYNLNAHARIHDPNSASEGRRRSHTCPVCGMTYDRKHKLADHLSTVHGMWQSASAEFKSEQFYNIDVQTMENQQHLLPLQVQEANLIQPSEIQSVIPQQTQAHSHQTQRVLQSQPLQMSVPLPPSQVEQVPLQISQTHQSLQPHHIVHTSLQQQHSPLHLQPHVQPSGPPHHILLTQHQVQQTLQTHISHHPTATISDVDVATVTTSTLQPISSMFQISVPSDTSAVHHNHMNSISSSMSVSSL